MIKIRPSEDIRSFVERLMLTAREARKKPTADDLLYGLPEIIRLDVDAIRHARPEKTALEFSNAVELAVESQARLEALKSWSASSKVKSAKQGLTCRIHGACGHTTAECRVQSRVATGTTVPSPNVANSTPTVKLAKNVTCYRCKQPGHISPNCPNKADTPYHVLILSDIDVGTAIVAPATLEDRRVHALVDSGANCTLVAKALAEELGLLEHSDSDHELSNIALGVHEKEAARFPCKEAMLQLAGRSPIKVNLSAIDGLRHEMVIGTDLFAALGIAIHGVPHTFPGESDPTDSNSLSTDENDRAWLNAETAVPEVAHEQQESVKQGIGPALDKNRAIPDTAACTHPCALIALDTGDAEPVSRRQYPIPLHLQPYVDRQVDKWLQTGRIGPGDPSSKWHSPLMAAAKMGTDGTIQKVRICLDPRHINPLLQQHGATILPRIEDVILACQGKEVFSSLDLVESFLQMPLQEADQAKTNFTHRGVLYKFRYANYGNSTMTSNFQGIMQTILEGLSFIRIYVDDVIILSDTIEDHIEHLLIVLERFNQYSLRINIQKSKFAMKELRVLGHIVSAQGVRPDPLKLSAFADLPPPTTGKQVESVLGCANYLRSYIPLYSTLCHPFEPLRKVKTIEWTPTVARLLEKKNNDAPVVKKKAAPVVKKKAAPVVKRTTLPS